MPGDPSSARPTQPAERSSVEDRLNRLEDEVRALRQELASLSPQKGSSTALVPFPKAQGAPGASKRPSLVRGWGGLIQGVFGRLGRVMGYCLTPGIRQVLLIGLTAAILLSNWWLPFASFWVVGPLWERAVVLVLAGIWWWLFWWGPGHTRSVGAGNRPGPSTLGSTSGSGKPLSSPSGSGQPNRWFGSLAG